MTYDLAIIGGGPAGVAAGVYASRKQLRTIFISKEWGGQSVVSTEVQNWIGVPSISGIELADNLKKHLKAYAGDIVDIKEGACVTKIEKDGEIFKVTTDGNETFEAKTVLISSGANRKKLAVPGAAEFDQKGLTYCASCDGPLFSGMDVVVVGGGNAGFETAAQLLKYTKSVTLFDHGPEFRADPVTVKKVLEHPNMKALHYIDIVSVSGDKMVNSIRYKNQETGEEIDFPTGGIFVEIGLIPNTALAGDLVKLDDYKRIEVDPRTQRTSQTGIWAAGDCTNGVYHQNNIAAGDAIKALEDIYVYLHAS